MANVINKLTLNGTIHNIASTAYAICSIGATTAAKTASILNVDTAGFKLIKGVTIHVQFTYTNEASDPTLNVNGTGAKPIKCHSGAVPGITPETSWYAGEVVTFTYDGAYWRINKQRLDLESILNRIAVAEQKMEDLGIPPIVEVE